MNQNKTVLQHMEKYGSISSYEAFDKYRITRLSARIHNLREEGYNIITENKVKNGTHYAVYRLEEE